MGSPLIYPTIRVLGIHNILYYMWLYGSCSLNTDHLLLQGLTLCLLFAKVRTPGHLMLEGCQVEALLLLLLLLPC